MSNSYKWDGILESEDRVKAEDLMDGIEAAENFINHGIGRNSFSSPAEVQLDADGKDAITGYSRPNHTSDGYIDQRHIFKPDFYDSPAPRMEAVSSQVHFRSSDGSMENAVIFNPSANGEAWEAIPGTACRLKLRDHAEVYFISSFYCFEVGGIHREKSYPGRTGNDVSDYPYYGGQTRYAGDVAFAIHGRDSSVSEYFGTTRRRIYTSAIFPVGSNFTSTTGENGKVQGNGMVLMTMQGRQQHTIMKSLSLVPGVYDFGLVFRSRTDGNGWLSYARSIQKSTLADIEGNRDGGQIPSAKNVIFCARNMVCDVVYDKRAKASEELEPWRTMNEKDPQAI